MGEDGDEVGELARDEDDEGSVVARADAGVEPGAVMVVSLHALPTDVAVVAPRQRNDLALVAQFVHLKSLQKFKHGHAWLSLDVPGPSAPSDEPKEKQSAERDHGHCLEPAQRFYREEWEADEAEHNLDEGKQADIEEGQPGRLHLLGQRLRDHKSLFKLLTAGLILVACSLEYPQRLFKLID